MRLSRNQKIKTVLLRVSHRINELCRTSNQIAPPDYLSSQYGGGSYFEIGLHFFRLLLDQCDIKRDSHVLEVGCGIGRMAMPLTAYLDPKARYEGFDIMPEGIDYCARHLTPAFPVFSFQRADIFNSYYNPSGSARVETYTFPYPDKSFDVVFSTSVFTHLPPAGVERYIQETARVLKPGGRCLHTCFMLNAESRAGIEKGLDPYGFRYQIDDFMTNNLKNVEDAVAMPEEMFASLYAKAGFDPLSRFYGSWSGRSGELLSHQDICVATRL
jgi:SAM-dependent methyltransferase